MKKVLFGSGAKKPRKVKVAGMVRTDLATVKKPKPLFGKLAATKKSRRKK